MVRIGSILSSDVEDKVPLIVVSGAWLENFGFEYGKKTVVDVTNKLIIIKPVDAED
jgi:hypothetical protein